MGRKARQKLTFKPLAIEQENAIDLLILGKSDKDVAEAVGVTRQTVWEWRVEHPLFAATLERRRAELFRSAQERLRASLNTAVETLCTEVDEGNLKAAVELLKVVGLYGDSTMNAIGEQDPHRRLRTLAEQRLTANGANPHATHLDALARRLDPTLRLKDEAVDEALVDLEAEFCEPDEQR